jgi:pimeloyl-ACP methyl ester carboxylesterase
VLRGRLARGRSESRLATQAAPAADLFNQKAEGTAWKTKPSWYVLATKDRGVHPELQRFVAKRMGATTVEVARSHVPMLSNPGLVLDVIRKAAATVQSHVFSNAENDGGCHV